MYSSSQESEVLKMSDSYVLHDDFEVFASYLGIDYDDYYQLVYHLPDEDELEPESVVLRRTVLPL